MSSSSTTAREKRQTGVCKPGPSCPRHPPVVSMVSMVREEKRVRVSDCGSAGFGSSTSTCYLTRVNVKTTGHATNSSCFRLHWRPVVNEPGIDLESILIGSNTTIWPVEASIVPRVLVNPRLKQDCKYSIEQKCLNEIQFYNLTYRGLRKYSPLWHFTTWN